MPNHLIGAFLAMTVLQPFAAFAAEREKPHHETPYSNAAVAREREARRIERELDRDREERGRRERDRQRREDRR